MSLEPPGEHLEQKGELANGWCWLDVVQGDALRKCMPCNTADLTPEGNVPVAGTS